MARSTSTGQVPQSPFRAHGPDDTTRLFTPAASRCAQNPPGPPQADSHQNEARARAVRPVAPTTISRRGLDITEVRLVGGFWGALQELNAWENIDSALMRLVRSSRGMANSFAPEAALTAGIFTDAELYMLLEAIVWELARSDDLAFGSVYLRLVERLAHTQRADGSLSTKTDAADRLRVGNLLQAAAARVRTTGEEDRLVQVARRAAHYVCHTLSTTTPNAYPADTELEMGLSELGRALGEPRYTAQARLLVTNRLQDTRSRHVTGGEIDVALDNNDDALLSAAEDQWQQEPRTYRTVGAQAHNVGPTTSDNWALSSGACATCAEMSVSMTAWRLYLATGHVRYANLMERAFYNLLAPVTQADPTSARPRDAAGTPATNTNADLPARLGADKRLNDASIPTCCAIRAARHIASWHAYLAALHDDELTLLHYASAFITVDNERDDRLVLHVDTQYPAQGAVHVEVIQAPKRLTSLQFRIPDWAHGATLHEAHHRARPVAPGFARIRNTLKTGDYITLELPVEPRLTWPHPQISALDGRLAVERGPHVLALDPSHLPPGTNIEDIRIDPGSTPRPAGNGAVAQGSVTCTPTSRTAPPRPPARPKPRQEIDLILMPQQHGRAPESNLPTFLPVF